MAPDVPHSPAPFPPKTTLLPDDDAFLDQMQAANFCFFWEQGEPPDRTNQRPLQRPHSASDTGIVASIASTGFGLTAICIARKARLHSHRRSPPARDLHPRFLWKKLPNHRGFFYHFANINTGERIWDSEVSSVDTAILLCGMLTCRRTLPRSRNHPARQRRSSIAWTGPGSRKTPPCCPRDGLPEIGFLPSRWDYYSELMMIYLLGMGSARILCFPHLACMETHHLRIRRASLHRLIRAAIRPSILAGLVRLPRQARQVRRLLPELGHRHRRASPLLPGTGKAISRSTATISGGSPPPTHKRDT